MNAGNPSLRATDPREVGGFRLTARIGEGAQGTVYLGESDTGQRVAVKLLHADFGRDPRARTAFERELAAARRVAPFCTARILAATADDDLPHIITEYVDGPSLKDMIAEHGVASPMSRSGWRSAPPRRWRRATRRASSTATSNRPTCCSARTAPRSSTSASPARSTPRPPP